MPPAVPNTIYKPTPRPQDFKSSVRRPPDFDRFWAETLAETERTPLNQRLEPDPLRSTPEVEVFEARYRSYSGLDIAGWYCRPRGRRERLPGMLFVPGYVSEPKLPTDLAMLGYAAFSAAPRGKLRSNSVFNPGYPGLLTHKADDRDAYGYRGFYIDAVRAFDFLSALPEVDPARVGVQGSSQGGALTLLVAALRADRVAAASAGAPYLCSMLDAAALTRSYPYEEINDYLRSYPDRLARVRETLDYYDIHNFASAIKCPIIVNIGLRDDVCPPETGFALFDVIGSADKSLFPYENCAHDAGTGVGHGETVNRFMSDRLRPEPVARTGPVQPPAPPEHLGAPDVLHRLYGGELTEDPRIAFEAYWNAVRTEVASLSKDPVDLKPMPLRSNEFSSVFAARFKGIGGYPLFAYFSVPTGKGPHPALIEAPGYGSVRGVPSVERRARYVVMAVCHRGQRLSDSSYRAAYPGLLTDGLPGAGSYKWREIVADCLRAADVLLARPEVDTRKVAAAGNDLAAITAAFRPQISTLLLNGQLLFRDSVRRIDRTDAYPLQEFNDFRRANPAQWPQAAVMLRTLYDPALFAADIKAETLIACIKADAGPAVAFADLVKGRCEIRANSGYGYLDHEWQEQWLASHLLGG